MWHRIFRIAFLLVVLAVPARADLGGWTMERFDARIVIQPDSTLEVTETITADFAEPRHGIYREIPTLYDVGLHLYDLRFRLLGVSDDRGRDRETKTTYEDNKVRIRIGSADRTVTGRQVYIIRYRVDRAILWEGDHAVLRWNATGTEWRVPIDEARVDIVLPEPLEGDRISYNAWTGMFGATEKNFTESRPDAETDPLRDRQPRAPARASRSSWSCRPTPSGEPSWLTRFGWWLGDNFVYGLIPLTFALCLGLWYAQGRDVPGRGTIVVEYQPPDDLGPAEVGTLIDEKVDMRDLSATIIDLAVRGYLTIEEVTEEGWLTSSTDYKFTRLKEDEGLKLYERALFDKLFSGDKKTVRLSELKQKFYTAIPKARDHLYRACSARKYFDGSPDTVRTHFLLFGLVAAGGSRVAWRCWSSSAGRPGVPRAAGGLGGPEQPDCGRDQPIHAPQDRARPDRLGAHPRPGGVHPSGGGRGHPAAGASGDLRAVAALRHRLRPGRPLGDGLRGALHPAARLVPHRPTATPSRRPTSSRR